MSGIKNFFQKLTSRLDQRPNDVPMGKRLGAYAIDWALGGMISGFPAVLIYGCVTGKSDMFSNLYIFEALGFEKYWGILAGLLCIIVAVIYYVIVPLKVWEGQTPGKHLLHLRIEGVDGEPVSLKQLLLRQVFTIFLLESSMFVISGYIRQMVTLLTRFYVDAVWQYIGIAITLISAILVIYSASHRALHDYIAGTKVVLAPTEDVDNKKKAASQDTRNDTLKDVTPRVKPVKNNPSHQPRQTEKKRLPKKAKK